MNKTETAISTALAAHASTAPIPTFVTAERFAELRGCTVQNIYRLTHADPDFPRPYRLTEGAKSTACTRYRAADIIAYARKKAGLPPEPEPAPPGPLEWLTIEQVADRYSVVASTVRRWPKLKAKFPKPVQMSTRCTRWMLADLVVWEATRLGIAPRKNIIDPVQAAVDRNKPAEPPRDVPPGTSVGVVNLPPTRKPTARKAVPAPAAAKRKRAA